MTTPPKLKILVLHGLVQTAETVAMNTLPLRETLEDIAELDYADGPENPGNSSRPWWDRGTNRWELTVRYWSEVLSKKQYDGIIGLSQGSAMAAVLVTMIRNPDKFPGFSAGLPQPLKFGIFCSGFISMYGDNGHVHFVDIPEDLPTLHTLDPNDTIVPPSSTQDLADRCKRRILLEHDEGHRIPVLGDYPQIMKDFILNSVSISEQ